MRWQWPEKKVMPVAVLKCKLRLVIVFFTVSFSCKYGREKVKLERIAGKEMKDKKF